MVLRIFYISSYLSAKGLSYLNPLFTFIIYSTYKSELAEFFYFTQTCMSWAWQIYISKVHPWTTGLLRHFCLMSILFLVSIFLFCKILFYSRKIKILIIRLLSGLHEIMHGNPQRRIHSYLTTLLSSLQMLISSTNSLTDTPRKNVLLAIWASLNPSCRYIKSTIVSFTFKEDLV